MSALVRRVRRVRRVREGEEEQGYPRHFNIIEVALSQGRGS